MTLYLPPCQVEYFPGLLALNSRKKLYSTFVGTFNEDNLYPFILKACIPTLGPAPHAYRPHPVPRGCAQVLAGKEKLSKLDNIPKLEKTARTMPPLNMKEL